MKKRRAILLALIFIATITAYVSWALWSPDPPLEFSRKIDAASQQAALEYVRENPPKKGKLTWSEFCKRLANPYKRRKEYFFAVTIDYTDGSEALHIVYPRSDQDVDLKVEADGSWHTDDTSDRTAILGRMFQK